VGFFVVNQGRYASNWEFQEAVWRALEPVAGSAGPETLVVVEAAPNVPWMYEEAVFEWSTPYLPPYLWRRSIRESPVVVASWHLEVYGAVVDGSQVRIAGYPTLPEMSFPLGNVIRVRVFKGRLCRVERTSGKLIHGPFEPPAPDEVLSCSKLAR
jgi:hypothetical protein